MNGFDWHLDEHLAIPERLPCTEKLPSEEGCEALCFRGPDWQGHPTRCFAWLGLPADAGAGSPAPAVVLVHGGLGTAFAEWVRRWTARGYAAIAIDHGGCLPIELAKKDHWQRLADGGPENCGGFPQVRLAPHDRWNYHAVANVIRAHSLIRSLDAVDETRVALTGISWGGYLSCLAAALDLRFRCAVPVYGCGYLDGSPKIGKNLAALGGEAGREWLELWDPQHYLPRVAMPLLFVNGSNDTHFVPPIWDASTRLADGPVSRSLQIGLKHSHKNGWAPAEIAAFIDHHLLAAPGLARFLDAVPVADELRGRLAEAAAVEATIAYTTATGAWRDRDWQTQPADLQGQDVRAAIPAASTAAYLQVTDARGLRISSPVYFADR